MAMALAGIGLMTAASYAIAAQRTAESVNAQAEFFYEDDEYCITEPRLTISREGETVLDQRLPDNEDLCRLLDLQVQSLDANEEPEVRLDFFSGGAHCCTWSQIYYYDSATSQYQVIEHFWGNVGYLLRDINGNGLPEFESNDDRFAYRFSSYASSRYPLQIWHYRDGEMVNVTRQFPQRVYDHAYGLWLDYLENRDESDEVVRSILAAYLADKHLIGQGEDGWQRVRQLYRRGDRQQFFNDLRQFLQATGYM